MRDTKRILKIFAKAPRPGRVKTRLAASVGGDEACAIYRQLVDNLLDGLSGISEAEIVFTPDDAASEVQAWLRPGWTLSPQGAGSLGQRLHRAFETAFADGGERAIVIGSDCPAVTAEDIRDAWAALGSCDLVLGPAADGGYWLIGLNQLHSVLFESIPWSTDQVLTRTLDRARAAGLSVQLLRMLSDIDTEEDWRSWKR